MRHALTIGVLAAMLGWSALAHAADDVRINTDDIGILQSCAASCTTGASPSGLSGDARIAAFQVNGSANVIVQFAFTGTVAGTIENSIDGGLTWTAVSASTFTATTSSPQKVSIADPVGWYRTRETTCTGCTLTTRYYAAPRGLH